MCSVLWFGKFSNPLLRRSIDILSDDPAADPAAEPGAAPEVDPAADPTADAAVVPAADLADQVGRQRFRTFPCEMEGLFTDFLTYCSRRLRQRPATNRTAMRTNLRLATGGRATVQGLQSVRGASKKCKLTGNPDFANVELLP